MSVDKDDFIIKTYIRKDGRKNNHRWYKHYCKVCGKSRSYLPLSKTGSGKCLSCACKNRVISEEQKKSISKTLMGNKNNANKTPESRRMSAIKSHETKRNSSEEKRQYYKNRMGAGKLGITVEEYLLIKDDLVLKRRISHNIRSQISNLLNGKTGKMRHLNWTVEDLKKHLESKFEPGMGWHNYGRKNGMRCWEVDHIIPIRARNPDGSYLFKNIEDPTSDDFKTCFDLNNLQPMWADENNKKNNKRPI